MAYSLISSKIDSKCLIIRWPSTMELTVGLMCHNKGVFCCMIYSKVIKIKEQEKMRNKSYVNTTLSLQTNTNSSWLS